MTRYRRDGAGRWGVSEASDRLDYDAASMRYTAAAIEQEAADLRRKLAQEQLDAGLRAVVEMVQGGGQ